MTIKCFFGFHKWNDCKCTRCGKHRDKQHEWDDCKCTRCGKVQHEFDLIESYEEEYVNPIDSGRRRTDEYSIYKCKKCGRTEAEITSYGYGVHGTKIERCICEKSNDKWRMGENLPTYKI